jgi:hypothetical protein
MVSTSRVFLSCDDVERILEEALSDSENTKDIRKVKIQSPENVCKAFFGGGGGFTCSTFTTRLCLFFNIVTMDRIALPGNEFFYSSVAEISLLLS